MKNLKNFAFGLLVAVLAVGFSAFTVNKTKVPAWVYVQQSDNQYNKIAYSTYNPTLFCEELDPKPCAFIQDEGDMDDHGPSLNETQARAIETLQETDPGLYTN